MSETQEHLQEIEVSMEEAKKAIDKMESFERLRDNTDFKKVIEEGYFEKESMRLVLLKADVNMQDDERQRDIMRQIDAIGTFREYLRSLYHIGRMAERSLEADRETQSELLEEELNNG
jgi:hypothetical protein